MKTKPLHKFLLLTAFLFGGIAAFAQIAKLTASEIAADEVCAKMNNVDISTKTAEELSSLFQSELVKTFTGHMNELMAEFGYTTLDGESGRKIGEEIGKKLLKRCPKFVDFSVKMAEEKEPPTVEETIGNSQGTITKVVSPQFTEITVKDAAGRETTFYWLRYFKGSEKFESAAVNIGKKVKLTWTETEFYLPKAHGYFKIKEIKSIDFLP